MQASPPTRNRAVRRRGEQCSPARISRCRSTPRANTVRPYVPLPIGPVGRGLTPPRHLAFIAIFLFICRGRRPRRPVQFCLIAKFMVYRRGGFHIRPGSLAQPRNCQEGSRPLPTNRRNYQPTTYIVTTHIPTGRRGRRPLQPNGNKQQRIEIVNNPIVECWPRAGASPSALGFLRARLRSVRAKREPKRP